MDDHDGPKPKTAPSWQRNDSTTSDPLQDTTSPSSDNVATLETREALLKQATKFLEDEDIRNAPVERRTSFLKSKGLTEHEISHLLQEGQVDVEHIPEVEVMEDYGVDRGDDSPLQSTNKILNTTEPEPPATRLKSSPQTQEDLPQPKKEIPPIITYPEFLIHSRKPPPLITARRLLTTFYVATGAATTIYGTSKYVVEPMIESLTAVRHSLFETASGNLDTLNSKLESAVSKIPEGSHQPDDDGSDVESMSSDPARFYNRSTATQTSPHLSRSTSLTSSPGLQPVSPNQLQEDGITEIYNKLTGIQLMNTSSLLETSISDLRKYLDGLPHLDSTQSGKLWEKSKPDEYSKLKAEIRGVKGVLLSARNFPSSVAVR